LGLVLGLVSLASRKIVRTPSISATVVVDMCVCPLQKRASILNNTDTSSGFLTVMREDAEHPGQLRAVQLPVGSVRVSLGYLSTFEDVYAFVQFLKRNYMDADPAAAAAAAAATATAAAAAS
jgi:selenocysteine lyase/cysteine desulfurase